VNTNELEQWAKDNGSGGDVRRGHKALSITSKVLLFRWNGGLAVGVGAEADGKARINALLDGLAWFSEAEAGEDVLHVVLGSAEEPDSDGSTLKEQLGAIGTLASGLQSGPSVRAWLASANRLEECQVARPAFTSSTPERWTGYLRRAEKAPVEGMAADVVAAVTDPAFALYPKLSSPRLWQMRLDGLEIGRVGTSTATLRLASRNIDAPGEPRRTWAQVVGSPAVEFGPNSVAVFVKLVQGLVQAWSSGGRPGGALAHGHPEHALEAHVISGRLQLTSSAGDTLRPALPKRAGVLAAAQFPTLWGDVTRPARYLDRLLVDQERRPWAVELKDQDAGGGHGSYLRHGLGQAVLYQHFIRSAEPLRYWFGDHGMDPTRCQTALAFPVAAVAAGKRIDRLNDLARRFSVDVIQFARPGTWT